MEPNPNTIPLNCALPFPPMFKIPPAVVKEHAVDIDNNSWIQTVRQRLNEVRPNSESSTPCTIFKSPEKPRRSTDGGRDFSPVVVSIGPYHNFSDRRSVTKGMQDHKWQCVRYLLSRHQNRDWASQLLDKCLITLRALDSEARSCYSENLSNFDPPKLASIMLTDGCFIIHLMLRQVVATEGVEEEVEVVERVGDVKGKAKMEKEEEEVELEMGKGEEEIEGPLLGMSWVWNLVLFDLLKLENQIPFFVIQTIFDIVKTPKDKGLDLVSLGLQLFRDVHPNRSKSFTMIPARQVHHLLHLFHSSLLPCKPKSLQRTASEWLPSAAEMKRSGIKFVKRESAKSFLDISFENGRIGIPPLHVFDYSKCLFHNLIVFEQCFADAGKYFTNYAKFMERIISSQEDARLLGLEGIVVKRHGTDEVVADLFKQHNSLIPYASDWNYLADVYRDANKYHKSSWRRWRAQLISNYFSNPWAGCALLAMVLLFLLVAETSFSAVFP